MFQHAGIMQAISHPALTVDQVQRRHGQEMEQTVQACFRGGGVHTSGVLFGTGSYTSSLEFITAKSSVTLLLVSSVLLSSLFRSSLLTYSAHLRLLLKASLVRRREVLSTLTEWDTVADMAVQSRHGQVVGQTAQTCFRGGWIHI